MEPVASLTEYIDMVCTQGDAYQTSFIDASFEVARSNEVVKELLVWKDKESLESFDDFLRVNARYIYIVISTGRNTLRNWNLAAEAIMSYSIVE